MIALNVIMNIADVSCVKKLYFRVVICDVSKPNVCSENARSSFIATDSKFFRIYAKLKIGIYVFGKINVKIHSNRKITLTDIIELTFVMTLWMISV